MTAPADQEPPAILRIANDRAEGPDGAGPRAAVRALEVCQRNLDRAREKGQNVRAAEKLLAAAEGFIRSGNYKVGRSYIERADRLLGGVQL